MNGDTEVFFEHMGNVVFAHKKDPGQSVEGQFFFHMVFNVAYYILVQRSPGMFPFGIVSFVYHAVYMKEQAVNAERDLRPPSETVGVQFFQQTQYHGLYGMK